MTNIKSEQSNVTHDLHPNSLTDVEVKLKFVISSQMLRGILNLREIVIDGDI